MSWNSTRILCAGRRLVAGQCRLRQSTNARRVRGQVYYQGRPLPQGMIVFTGRTTRGHGPSAKEIFNPTGATLTTDGQPGRVGLASGHVGSVGDAAFRNQLPDIPTSAIAVAGTLFRPGPVRSASRNQAGPGKRHRLSPGLTTAQDPSRERLS